MDTKIRLWDWKESEAILEIKDVKNTTKYQPIHFKYSQGMLTGCLFLEDDGTLLDYDFIQDKRKSYDLGLSRPAKENLKQKKDPEILHCGNFYNASINKENWKMEVDHQEETNRILVYEHVSSKIMCFQINT